MILGNCKWLYAMRCSIWHHLHNLKNMTNTHGEVLFLVKLKTKACNYAKSNTPQ